jgi:FkbM family methyltransferase
MHKLLSGQQLVVDQFQRELDEIEKTCPMQKSYSRIDPYIFTSTQAGKSFQFIVYNNESKNWYDNGKSNGMLERFYADNSVREGDVVFDLGCNSGFLTAWFGLAVGPKGKVHAFDMMPWNAAATRAQARLNYLDNIVVHEVGVSNRDDEFEIEAFSSKTLNKSGQMMAPLKIKVVDLTKFADLEPTFFKVDIEGAEHEISQCDLSVFKKLDRILLEYHTKFIRDRKEDPTQTLIRFMNQGFTGHKGKFDGRPIRRNEDLSELKGAVFFNKVPGHTP